MPPDEETENGDGHACASDPGIAKNPFARKTRDQLADHAHSRQDHDVNSRMRIEPKEMLKQNGVAAQLRIENTDAPEAFHGDKRKSNGEHRRGQHHDQTGRVK